MVHLHDVCSHKFADGHQTIQIEPLYDDDDYYYYFNYIYIYLGCT